MCIFTYICFAHTCTFQHPLSALQERKQAWGTKQFQQYIGADVTSLLSVPVWIMEPFTILQKAAEIMEYTDLLDAADKEQDPYDRCRALFACMDSLGMCGCFTAVRAWYACWLGGEFCQ